MNTIEDLRNSDAHSFVLNTLKYHLTNQDVLNVGISAIFALASDEETRQLLIEEEGCETVLEIINSHFSNNDIMNNCCKILIWFLNNEEGIIRIKNKISNTFTPENKKILLDKIFDICNDN